MIRFLAAAMVSALPVAAAAQSFTPLGTSEISSTLNGATVLYDSATQRFLSQGRLLYNNGGENWGRWKAEEGQYCSQWPPADGWTCYDVERNGAAIRFTGPDGRSREGRLAE
ncbi:hypothetical protein SAMN04490244_104221 [Tranquillimonas rosea]|uniref:Uncharacterized protein n=1 Tax=Tranquillimonas rosea TaxID=641238 RepID=A0A1H9TJ58_9RHOB|nr:hypothetical protein [Tranquillimonas rosea]SER97255.1 hypothetical protein SAMN04490244_104221 [Tranquillimonas rosea]